MKQVIVSPNSARNQSDCLILADLEESEARSVPAHDLSRFTS